MEKVRERVKNEHPIKEKGFEKSSKISVQRTKGVPP